MLITDAALPEDIHHLKTISEEAFSDSPDSSIEQWFSFEEMQELVKQGRGICLKAVTENAEIVGTIFAQQDSPVNGMESREKWVIILAAVDPSKAGQRIGSGLLQELEIRVKKTGATKLFVYTNKEDEQVINFYHRNNYEDAGWIKDYQYGKGNSAVFLLKYLDNI